ncbi:unnamed protein product, partial [marine sediment metagenome]
MKSLKIITGNKGSIGWPWAERYVAHAFRKLGHKVTESGDLYRGGFDLGFVVDHQRFTVRQWRDYPVGYFGSDCTVYRGKYRKIAKHFDVFF